MCEEEEVNEEQVSPLRAGPTGEEPLLGATTGPMCPDAGIGSRPSN